MKRVKNIKKVAYLLAVFVMISCSNDSDSNDVSSNETGLSGSLARFTILDDFLYTVDNRDLNVFDISNREQPVLVNTVNIGFDIETLFSFRTYLYIGSRDGMFIYSAANQMAPVLLADVQHFRSCDPVIANETHAYVTLKGGTICGSDFNVLQVYDVNNVEQPILIAERDMAGPAGMAFYNNYLIVCDDVVKIFDITDPENISQVHSINRPGFDAIVRDNLLILVADDGIYQYDLDPSDIQNETELSAISL